MATAKAKHKTVPQILGTSGAAQFARESENNLRRNADAGLVRCERDHAGRRVFKRADLERYVASKERRG
jgi:hypothetical protein